MTTQDRIAIIGAGHAGGRVAQHLNSLGHQGPVYLIGAEMHAPYERPALSKELLLGKVSRESLTLAPATFWDVPSMTAMGIERIHDVAVDVDVDNRVVQLAAGRKVAVDTLVVATGGSARRSVIPGSDLAGVHVLRNVDDSVALRHALSTSRSLAVIGAGVIGMEVAASARAMGIAVTVLEAGQSIMARCLPPSMAQWLANEHAANGVNIETGVLVDRIVSLEGIAQTSGGPRLRIEALRNIGHSEKPEHAEPLNVDVDVVLISIGIDCCPAFLTNSSLAGPHGISVDAYCRSVEQPWIYAAGDVAHTLNFDSGKYLRQETWRNAEHQAKAVAEFITGRTEPYREIPWMWTDQFGHNIQVVGMPDASDYAIMRGQIGMTPTTVVMIRDGAVSGGVLINQGRDKRPLEALVRERRTVDLTKLADATIALREFT